MKQWGGAEKAEMMVGAGAVVLQLEWAPDGLSKHRCQSLPLGSLVQEIWAGASDSAFLIAPRCCCCWSRDHTLATTRLDCRRS